METHPLRNEGGELIGFEVPNWPFLSSRGVAKFLSQLPGITVTRVRRLFERSEIHAEFAYQGDAFSVWEPYGDNSRYWVGPSEEAQISQQHLAEVEALFKGSWPGPISHGLARVVSLVRKRSAG